MQPNDELCLCFHVTKRKVANFIRLEKPRRAAQLSECFGAGTGCGWCRPFLERMFDAAQVDEGDAIKAELPDAQEYARERGAYVRAGGGTPPPGATPASPEDPASEESN
ncbi:MAG: (2Fe-2S)-binding protein [Planctomycetota bacterium]